MKRWQFLLAAAGVLLLVGWGLHKRGWICGTSDASIPGRANQVQNADPMDTAAGWRYRQNRPHHWRYIVLQK